MATTTHKRDQMSNKMIQKGLAFLRKESGTVVAKNAQGVLDFALPA